MAKANSSIVITNNPALQRIAFLTADPIWISFAAKLQKQWREIDQAHQQGKSYDYKPIPIPKKLQAICG